MMEEIIDCAICLPEKNKTVLVWSFGDWEFGRINSKDKMEVYSEGYWQEDYFTYWTELPKNPENKNV